MGFVEGDKGRNGLTHHQRILVTRHGKVYDVTDFASRHPGGKDLLLKHSGRDVDELMGSADSHVHSKAAYSIMEKYYVGPEGEVREEVEVYLDYVTFRPYIFLEIIRSSFSKNIFQKGYLNCTAMG